MLLFLRCSGTLLLLSDDEEAEGGGGRFGKVALGCVLIVAPSLSECAPPELSLLL